MMQFRVATIKQSELGTNCWLPARFVGGQCSRVHDCKYPERHGCKAVEFEIARTKARSIAVHEVLAQSIKKLEAY